MRLKYRFEISYALLCYKNELRATTDDVGFSDSTSMFLFNKHADKFARGVVRDLKEHKER